MDITSLQKRQILFLLDSLQTGGAELSLLHILSRFRQYEPVVIKLYSKSGELNGQFAAAGITVIELNLPRNLSALFKVRTHLKLFKDLQPVLIHSTLFRSDIFARNLGHDLGVPVINSLVNNTYSLRRYRLEPFHRKIKLLFYHLLDYLTANRAQAFVANSATIKKSICSALPIPAEKVRVIYRGRMVPDLPYNQAHPEPALVNAEIDEIVFLNVSRLLTRKGHSTLIKAFSEVVKVYPNANLKIAGDGPELKSLKDLTQKLHIVDRVQFLGTVSDVGQIYGAAHFFVFPSHYEGLPGVLIEAMLARLPIIASDIPENKECVKEDMALFHKIGDPGDLAKVMLEAVKRTDWPERTMAAFHFATQTFDVNNIAAQYEQYYEEVIQSFNRTAKN